MEFEFTDSLWIEEKDLEEMVSLCLDLNITPLEAFNEVALGWESEYYNKKDFVSEEVVAEIERRLN
jgi:hypothetical protein